MFFPQQNVLYPILQKNSDLFIKAVDFNNVVAKQPMILDKRLWFQHKQLQKKSYFHGGLIISKVIVITKLEGTESEGMTKSVTHTNFSQF